MILWPVQLTNDLFFWLNELLISKFDYIVWIETHIIDNIHCLIASDHSLLDSWVIPTLRAPRNIGRPLSLWEQARAHPYHQGCEHTRTTCSTYLRATCSASQSLSLNECIRKEQILANGVATALFKTINWIFD